MKEQYNYEMEKLIRENRLMADYIIKLEEKIKDLKSYAVLFNTQKKKAESKLKDIQTDLSNTIEIDYEEGSND